MSRAFIKEDAGDDSLPERHQPSGPNYVTVHGLDLLRKRVQSLQAGRGGLSKEEERDLRYWQARLGCAIIVDHSKSPPQDICFGAMVSAKDAWGKAYQFQIVGQDEAEEGGDAISWDSVLARVLIGHKPGEKIVWAREERDLELEITSVRYASLP